ncbi:MAG: hypothetical protein JST16_02540 [Bdellovibrionales bacterium]|nr:hypothetical protein [Bdellovibrionales bacterium]
MSNQTRLLYRSLLLSISLIALVGHAKTDDSCDKFKAMVQEGDIVLLDVGGGVWDHVEKVSGGWASHVSVVAKDEAGEWVVFESTTPRSRVGNFCGQIAHGLNSHLAIRRLNRTLQPNELARLHRAMESRMNIDYDSTFNLDDPQTEFCSKFVHEVFHEALGVDVGRAQSFGELLDSVSPSDRVGEELFWNYYFKGALPREQRTLTPHSIFIDKQLTTIYDSLPSKNN